MIGKATGTDLVVLIIRTLEQPVWVCSIFLTCVMGKKKENKTAMKIILLQAFSKDYKHVLNRLIDVCICTHAVYSGALQIFSLSLQKSITLQLVFHGQHKPT